MRRFIPLVAAAGLVAGCAALSTWRITVNAFKSHQLSRTIIRAARATVVAFGLAGTALGTLASPLDTRTVHQAEAASLYDTYHDLPTGFVFVKLPSGWRFVGRDLESRSHEVFLDTATGFVFVKTSEGWRFITPKD